MPFLATADGATRHDARDPYAIVGGKIEGDVTDVDQVLRLGGLDWTVETHEFTSTVVDPAWDDITLDGVTHHDERVQSVTSRTKRQVIRRDPSGDVSELNAVVDKDYEPIQHRQIVELGQAVVDSSDARWGAAGHTHGGLRSFYQLKFPEGIEIGGRDAVGLSLVLFGGHDGLSAVKGTPTATRLQCTNQFSSLQRSAAFSIHHTKGAQVKIDEIRQAIGLTFKVGAELQEIGERLIRAPFTSKELLQLVDVIYPVQHNDDGSIADVTGLRRQAIRNIFVDEDDQANIRGTRWGGLQAVIAYEDWHRPVRARDKDLAHARRQVTHAADPVKDHATRLLLAGI